MWLAAALLVLARPTPAPLAMPCAQPREAGGAGPLASVCCSCGSGRPAAAGALPLLFGGRLDLNRAPAHALEALPGIGPIRARAIVRARERRPFCALEELVRVPGIGPRSVARLTGRARAGCSAGPGSAGPAALYTPSGNP